MAVRTETTPHATVSYMSLPRVFFILVVKEAKPATFWSRVRERINIEFSPVHLSNYISSLFVDRDSSGSIATRYGLDGRGIESW